jgi:hypothetical protein
VRRHDAWTVLALCFAAILFAQGMAPQPAA